VEFVLQLSQLVGKGRPFEKSDSLADSLVLGDRAKQSSITVISCTTKQNPLAMDVSCIVSEVGFERSALLESVQ
jgi:hypothetical protein